MSELSYPSFPRRAFLAVGTVMAVLSAAAIVVNRSDSPGLHGCAVAAERVMVARNFSVDMMELAGPGPIPACRGLTARQYAHALLGTYQIEYGGRLPREPVNHQMPPPAFKALSARSQLRAQ